MIVHIEDRDVFLALSHIDVRAYLSSQGWRDEGRIGDKGTIHVTEDKGGETWEILLPSRRDLVDYANRMAEAVRTIAKLENRSELAVLGDLQASGSDVIRLRSTDADVFGAISIRDGVVLHEDAENLLYAAACSAIRPAAYYHARKIDQAVEYMNSVRLGQSERGSYVLNLLSPVSPALKRPAQLSLDSSFEDDPYPRLVTRRLNEALAGLSDAVTEAAVTDDFKAFEDGVSKGVSANLCDAVARLIRHAKGIEIGLTWARVRPTPSPNPKHVFANDFATIIEEAAREFRRTSPKLDETVSGFVIALERSPQDFDGRATLQAFVDDRPRRISAVFERSEYKKVIHAFESKIPVSVEGDIYPAGARLELRNPRNLMFLPTE
ncbi:hypothetical protein [Azospirillum sp.]|uniref:hypothetical protein n=1 Tax=Azospirillum sp. TaxID=34012 RepID=UPI002D3B3DB1|nr:hypothetical protein [Azospirillum sp.]HYD67727.1 hypothetical protein [Azospirillum sp.]